MGFNLTCRVEEIMDKEFIRVDSTTKLKEVIEIIIASHHDEALIMDHNYKSKLKGIFTRSDVSRVKNDQSTDYEAPIEHYISGNIETVRNDELVRVARNVMIEKSIGRLVVLKNKKVVGMLTNNNIRDNFYLKIDELYEITKEAFDNIYEAVCICDKDCKVIYWNKGAEKLYGIKEDDIINRYVNEDFPNAMALRVAKERKAFKNLNHEPVKGKKVVLSAVPIFNNSGEMVAIITTDRDITEVANLSEELKIEKEKSKYFEDEYRKHHADKYSFNRIIGKNKKIIEAVTLAQKVAASRANVMITGESGTGKDVFARAIHEASGRKGKFVAVNCSAIPDNLLESELFGYDSGAFTGAIKGGKIGKFELADNGTLFLDEIGDMPLNMQSKLLRVLQDGVISRVGSEKTIQTNFRVIAATNKNLKEAIEQKEFRSDLFYRLSVVHIEIPPLRERKDDILEFCKVFIKEISENENINIEEIDENIFEILQYYHWEGNIRELRNVIQRIVVLSDNGTLSKGDIPSYIIDSYGDYLKEYEHEIKIPSLNYAEEWDLENAVRELEIKMIKKAMKRASGNKAEAAKILKINRSTLYYKLKFYNIT